MDAVKFLEEYNRMCNTYNDCVGCPMHDKPFCHPHDMTTNDEQKKLVNAVERWSCEHSIVTNEMSDTISRQAAIDALFELYEYQRDIDPTEAADLVRQGIYLAEKKIEQLPFAQPERLTDDDFETIRIHLDAYKEKLCNQGRWKGAKEYQRIYDRFMAFASAQSEIIRCEDCIHNGSFDTDCPIGWNGKEYCSFAEGKDDEESLINR